MKLTINLATKTYLNTRLLNVSVAVALVLLFLLSLMNVKTVASNAGEVKRLTSETVTLEGKGKEKSAVSDKEYQALLARIKVANDIIEQKTFNWLLLLDNLESVVPDGVALTSVEPGKRSEGGQQKSKPEEHPASAPGALESKGDGVKLSGVARNFTAVRAFMENLENSKFFTEVYLVSQSVFQGAEKQKGITFSISCKANYK